MHLLICVFFQRPHLIDRLLYECDGAADRSNRGGEESFRGTTQIEPKDISVTKFTWFQYFVHHGDDLCFRRSVWGRKQPRDLNGGERRCSVLRRGWPGDFCPSVDILIKLWKWIVDLNETKRGWPGDFWFLFSWTVSISIKSFLAAIILFGRITGQPVGELVTADEVSLSSFWNLLDYNG